MKNKILKWVCGGALLSMTGCAAVTAGIKTARDAFNSAVDNGQVAVNKGFDAASGASTAAEKIATGAKDGAVSVITPVVTP